MSFPLPQTPFNPLTSPTPLAPHEILAGPFGLIAYLLLVPVVRLLAPAAPRAAIIGTALVWMIATVGVTATVVLLAGMLAAAAWIVWLGALARRGALSTNGMIALVWIGLHVLVLPLWWFNAPEWYGWQPSRMAMLHNIGAAYLMLRMIGWGVTVAREPWQPLLPIDTAAWLLYPPAMRLGPMMSREQFLERFDAWRSRSGIDWRAALPRFGGFLFGGVVLLIVMKQTPHVAAGRPDFLSAPELYRTDELLRVLYLAPLQVYLMLWSYNELAAGLSRLIGIAVDDNFNLLPAATSVRDFWRRWHITLGAWLREHIYIPLGGNRGIVWLNYLVLFVYVGVWHGPAWSFVVWGVSQAIAMTVQRGWDRLRARQGWADPEAPRPWWYVGACWLITLHYQAATILIFMDFEHCGVRLFGELARRALG